MPQRRRTGLGLFGDGQFGLLHRALQTGRFPEDRIIRDDGRAIPDGRARTEGQFDTAGREEIAIEAADSQREKKPQQHCGRERNRWSSDGLGRWGGRRFPRLYRDNWLHGRRKTNLAPKCRGRLARLSRPGCSPSSRSAERLDKATGRPAERQWRHARHARHSGPPLPGPRSGPRGRGRLRSCPRRGRGSRVAHLQEDARPEPARAMHRRTSRACRCLAPRSPRRDPRIPGRDGASVAPRSARAADRRRVPPYEGL